MTDPDELASIAVELAVRVRDHDPSDNGKWLARRLPDPADWFQLTFVLAAAVPDDQSWLELTAWAQEPATVRHITDAPTVRPHGTLAAVSRHRYRREALCQPCRDAARVYDRERKAARRALAAQAITPDRRTA